MPRFGASFWFLFVLCRVLAVKVLLLQDNSSESAKVALRDFLVPFLNQQGWDKTKLDRTLSKGKCSCTRQATKKNNMISIEVIFKRKWWVPLGEYPKYTTMYLLYMAYVGHGGIFGKQLLGYSPNPHLPFDICSTERTLRMLFLGNAFCSERCTLHKQISSIRGHVA